MSDLKKYFVYKEEISIIPVPVNKKELYVSSVEGIVKYVSSYNPRNIEIGENLNTIFSIKLSKHSKVEFKLEEGIYLRLEWTEIYDEYTYLIIDLDSIVGGIFRKE